MWHVPKPTRAGCWKQHTVRTQPGKNAADGCPHRQEDAAGVQFLEFFRIAHRSTLTLRYRGVTDTQISTSSSSTEDKTRVATRSLPNTWSELNLLILPKVIFKFLLLCAAKILSLRAI
jgi:hypothetical protein